MDRQRLPVVLSAAALVVAALCATSPGIAALQGTVRVALFAKNAAKVGGIGASKKPKAGKLLPLGKNGKFPASVGSNVACSSATTSTLDSTGLVGQYTSSSIGIDGLGVISYYDSSGSNLDLKVAHCVDVACSAATSTTLDSPGTVGWYTSLAIGADGLPLVTYRDVSGTAVKVAHCPNVFCVGYLRRR